MRIAIILLSISLAATLLFVFVQYKKAARFEGSKFEWTYDTPRDLVIAHLREDGRLVEVDYDRNSDLEDDSIVLYARNGQVSTVWVDEDFNGLLEVQWLYDPQEQLIARYEDVGQDGYVEEYIQYKPDSLFIYRDGNMDGRFDSAELVRSEKR